MTKLETRSWKDVAQEHWDQNKKVLIVVLYRYCLAEEIEAIEKIGWRIERHDPYDDSEDGSKRVSALFLRPEGC